MPPNACPTNWSYYRNHCYRSFKNTESLQWYEAEAKCFIAGSGRDGHLVSILDSKEMSVVHYFLINVWSAPPYSAFYIGLVDVTKEGVYRWSDNNPMSYTDWAPASSLNPVAQPDGGAYEDCTVLKVDSGHSTANWHDIPCSLGKHSSYKAKSNASSHGFLENISTYICKMDALQSAIPNVPNPIALHQSYMRQSEIVADRVRAAISTSKHFVCKNLEVISLVFRCNGIPNCRDGSDEDDCHTLGPTSTSCMPSQFRCANGRCVAINAYCDFTDDCGDGSDERHCDRRNCRSYEFKCANGECIPASKRCDLLTDCKDGSDEVGCSSGSYCANTTFQCYYGNCIPLYAVCDKHRDCPGKFYEDEQPRRCLELQQNAKRAQQQSANVDSNRTSIELQHCANRNRPRTCRDLYKYHNIRENGKYFVEADDDEPQRFLVECIFMVTYDALRNSSSTIATTVIHHDSETSLYIKADGNKVVDAPTSYIRRITYDISLNSIISVISESHSCRQYISWKCTGSSSGFSFNSSKPIAWWTSRYDEAEYYWGGANYNGTCGCWPNCVDEQLKCNCDTETNALPPLQWRKDAGYLSDKHKLPVRYVQKTITHNLWVTREKYAKQTNTCAIRVYSF